MAATTLELLGTDEQLLTETRGFNAGLERLLATMPPVHTVPPEVTRQAREEGRGPFPPMVVLPEGQDRSIPGRDGPIGLRVFVPPRVDGVYLHLHGGGWVLGSARLQDPFLWEFAQRSNLAIVSADYRLAPEHRYPAAPDDCEDAAAWLVEHARQEFGSQRLVIGGESAGAHLAVVTLLRLRDRHGITGAFGAANLVFGVYDLSGTPSQRHWGERFLMLSTPVMEWFAREFLGEVTLERARQPDISPLWAELHDLPPALLSVGTLDPLLDDTLFMAQRWRAAGNTASVEVYAEGIHGFTGFPIGIAQRSRTSQAAFLGAAVAG